MTWIILDPSINSEHLGLLPMMLDPSDPRPAREQFDENYQHGGGWRPFNGFTLHDDAAVAVETFTGELLLSRADEISAHATVLDGYAAAADYDLETVTGLLTSERRPLASIPAPAGAGTG